MLLYFRDMTKAIEIYSVIRDELVALQGEPKIKTTDTRWRGDGGSHVHSAVWFNKGFNQGFHVLYSPYEHGEGEVPAITLEVWSHRGDIPSVRVMIENPTVNRVRQVVELIGLYEV